MPEKLRISNDDTILKRIAPSRDEARTVQQRGDALTATSLGIKPGRRNPYPSWSLQRVTSAQSLLEIEEKKGREMTGWSVAAVEVRQVRELGLVVVHDPTDEDPGHCLIEPAQGEQFSNKVWSQLAKKTRIVHTWKR